jgi:hypothetical protein
MSQQKVLDLIIKIHDENNLGLEKNKWGTDKMNPKSYYEKFYSKIISQLGEIRFILEVGVRGGASMFLWQKLFPEASVIGCDLEDIDTELGPKSEYVTLKNSTFIKGNAYSEEISSGIDAGLDLAIDDGSHFLKDQLIFVELYSPKLSNKGVLVIEDVQRGYLHVLQVFRNVNLNEFKVQAHDFRFNKVQYDDFVITINRGKTSRFYIFYSMFRALTFLFEHLALKLFTKKYI